MQDLPSEWGGGEVDPRFVSDVLSGLRDTNFAHGWGSPAMYEDFILWCERSEEADSIITEYYADFPLLVLDREEGVHMLSLGANAATRLMKALIEAFEVDRLRKLFDP